MAARWRTGDRPPAEEYLDAHPALWDDADAALELIAEELALRGEFGPAVTDARRRLPDARRRRRRARRGRVAGRRQR